MSNSNLVMALALLIATSGLAVRGKASTMLALINFNALMIMYLMVTSSGAGLAPGGRLPDEDLMTPVHRQAQAGPESIGRQLADVAREFRTPPDPDNVAAAKNTAESTPGSPQQEAGWGN